MRKVKMLLKKLLGKETLLSGPSGGTASSPYIWEGIYGDMREVPTAGPGFDGETWLTQTRQYTSGLLSEYGRDGTVSSRGNGILPVLVSVAAANGKVRILDFGGGMGASYLHCLSVLQEREQIEYHVVEKPGVCREGSRLFRCDPKILFHHELPDLHALDIVFMNSVLQYVEDYGDVLQALCSYRAKLLLLANTSAGSIPTYATAQKNVSGSAIAYRFHNLNELVELVTARGYRLVYKDLLPLECDQGNFPEDYRLTHTCTLLFSLGEG